MKASDKPAKRARPARSGKAVLQRAEALCGPYRITRGKGFRLRDHDPRDTGAFGKDDEEKGERMLDEARGALARLQDMLYAQDRWGVLLVFQAMDAAGKDGAIKHVMSGVNPQGCQVFSFKAPTSAELAHDFLWRVHHVCPPRGEFAVFNRSHYEDVLVVRVHNLVPPDVWGPRYDEINAFERELVDTGTTLVKVAMFVSLEEQKQRLAERLERPDKYWKYNPADIDERKLWPKYQEAYQVMLERTSTDYAPWHIVPCDRKWYSRLAITELLIEALKSLNMAWPPPDFDIEVEKVRLANV